MGEFQAASPHCPPPAKPWPSPSPGLWLLMCLCSVSLSRKHRSMRPALQGCMNNRTEISPS